MADTRAGKSVEFRERPQQCKIWMMKYLLRHDVIGRTSKPKIGFVDDNHRIGTFLQKRLHIVWRKGVSRRIVRRCQQHHPGFYPSNERDHLINLVVETRLAVMHRILYHPSANLAGNRLIVPPRILRHHHCLPGGDIAMDDLFEHVLAPVAKKNARFRKTVFVRERF